MLFRSQGGFFHPAFFIIKSKYCCEFKDFFCGGEVANIIIKAVLTEQSRQLLLEKIPPIHPVVLADHVTIAFKPTRELYDKFSVDVGKTIKIPVVGHVADDNAQAALVRADSINPHPHITISRREDVKSKYSNTLLASHEVEHIDIFTVEAVIEIKQNSLPSSTRR